MAEHFIFKGGTSLSKGWKLIERFSEDIDIALAPEAFGKEYQQSPSKSYVKQLKKAGCAFTSTVIREELEKQFVAMAIPDGMIQIEIEAVDPTIPDKDPQTIYIRYQSLYDPSNYIAGVVKVEFGVRALREPFTVVNIQSIIAAETSTLVYTENPFQVTVVEPRKTFMEKLMLLHEKFLSGRTEGDVGERQSRHLSDLLSMTKKGIANEVINDPELYSTLLNHRSHYVRLKDIEYDSMQLRQLFFLPPWELLEKFRQDYNTMLEQMIYGNPPDFDTLMNDLRELNMQLAALGHTHVIKEVIDQARMQIDTDEWDGDLVKTSVVHLDPNLPIGLNNPITFETEFVKTKTEIIFHRIKVQ